MSSTQAQIEANRANSLLSTGPKSEVGKQAAAANSTATGLTGTRIFIPPGQEDKFCKLNAGLMVQIRPESPLQLQLFDVLIHAAWNVLRCIELEDIIQNEAIALGLPDALFDDDLSRKLDRIYRYKKMHESTQRRITAQLCALQTEQLWRREAQVFLDDSDIADTAPIIANLNKRLVPSQAASDRRCLDALRAFSDPPPARKAA